MHESIWNQDECLTALDDVILKTALSSLLEIEGRQLVEENERLKNDPRFQLSPEIDQKIQGALRRTEAKQKLRVVGKRAGALVSKVAVIFFAVFMGISSTMAVSAEFRRVIYNLILSYDERYTQIERNTEYTEFIDSDAYTWVHIFAPTVMPPEYKLSSISDLETIYTVEYKNNTERFINFAQMLSTGSGMMRVDTEKAQKVNTIFIGDSEALLVEKDGIITITWQSGNFLLSIITNDEIDIAIDVAKNIKLLR